MKPIRAFTHFLGVIDTGDGIQALVSGYNFVPGLDARTSRVVGDFVRNDKGEVIRFETRNSIYERVEGCQ